MEFKYSDQPKFIKEMLKYANGYEYKEMFRCLTEDTEDDKIKSVRNFNDHAFNKVILYPTDDVHDLEALYLKYMMLEPDDKAESDDKAVEIFGKTNPELYKEFRGDIKVTVDKPEDTYTVDEEIENTSVFSNDLPMLTPKELVTKVEENYSCFNEQDAEDIKLWREEYALLGNGIKTPDYNAHNLQRINILRKAIYENNTDAILQCGWIPGVEFNSENRVKATQLVKEKMELPSIISYDAIEESVIQEASNSKDKKAVSVVFVAGSSLVAKTIRKVQGTQFSHASISLDDDLSRIYSYNMRNGFNGLTYESVKGYIEEGVQKMGVYTFLVSDKVYKNLEKQLDNFNLYIDKTKYSVLNLLTIAANIPLDMDMKMVCSEFVDKLLKLSDLDLTNKKSSLVGPKDLINAANTKSNIVEVFYGHPKKFKPKEVEKKIKNLKRSNLPIYEFVEYDNEIITEAKSLPIQFDTDGNLIVKNLRKINFEQEYADSHRLLKEYEKTDSYEPMKFELAKMHFFITLLEKKIYKQGKDKSMKELKVRARFLNDFKKYLKIVMNNDPSFNFTEYFEQTQFNDALIKIDKDTLKFGYQALKYIIKG